MKTKLFLSIIAMLLVSCSGEPEAQLVPTSSPENVIYNYSLTIENGYVGQILSLHPLKINGIAIPRPSYILILDEGTYNIEVEVDSQIDPRTFIYTDPMGFLAKKTPVIHDFDQDLDWYNVLSGQAYSKIDRWNIDYGDFVTPMLIINANVYSGGALVSQNVRIYRE